MLMPNDGFVRVKVWHHDKRTTISLDDVLFEGLRRREGGFDEAIRWLRGATGRIDELQVARDPIVQVDNAGVSRLVQRLVLHHLLS